MQSTARGAEEDSKPLWGLAVTSAGAAFEGESKLRKQDASAIGTRGGRLGEGRLDDKGVKKTGELYSEPVLRVTCLISLTAF